MDGQWLKIRPRRFKSLADTARIRPIVGQGERQVNQAGLQPCYNFRIVRLSVTQVPPAAVPESFFGEGSGGRFVRSSDRQPTL